ncbi:MAG: hypothetical protein LCH78_17925 [Proteobacteria bacterium]|nr:hypothetical protein [Pseudomonadota bacterium]
MCQDSLVGRGLAAFDRAQATAHVRQAALHGLKVRNGAVDPAFQRFALGSEFVGTVFGQ